MSFLRLWLTGYLHPGRAFEALRDKPAPHYGLYGVLMRGLIMGLVWYLPRALMGLQPAMAPILPFPPVETTTGMPCGTSRCSSLPSGC